MKTVFVTGAEGFTGKHLTEYLKGRGYEVVGGVRNRARKLAFEKQYGRAIVCEVADGINVARAIASIRPDVIVHLAGATNTQATVDEPLTAYQTIVSAWANVLDAVRRSVPRAKVVLASSWEVYGDSAVSGQPCNENTPCKPITLFGSFKSNAEAVARTYFDAYHLDITIARPFPYTGANQSDAGLFAHTAARLAHMNGSGTLSFPSLNAQCDLGHVSDVVDAYLKLIESGKPNEAYNICTGTAQSIEQFSSSLARGMGKSATFTGGGESAYPSGLGDNTKLRQLGWQPQRGAETALSDLIRSLTPQTANAAA